MSTRQRFWKTGIIKALCLIDSFSVVQLWTDLVNDVHQEVLAIHYRDLIAAGKYH